MKRHSYLFVDYFTVCDIINIDVHLYISLARRLTYSSELLYPDPKSTSPMGRDAFPNGFGIPEGGQPFLSRYPIFRLRILNQTLPIFKSVEVAFQEGADRSGVRGEGHTCVMSCGKQNQYVSVE